VRKIDLTVADYLDATVARVEGVRGKAIAVDDVGRVYLAEGSAVKVYNAGLTTELYSIGTTKCEGVAVAREGGTLALYATDRTDMTLTRWELGESGDLITGAAQAGLDGDGQIGVTGANSLRGCEIDPLGRIWMADIGAGLVFRVDGDGSGLISTAVGNAIDVGFDGTQALVTQYTNRTITALDLDLNPIGGPLTAPWAQLELDPIGQSGGGAFSGIVVIPGLGFYVANEAGQTAHEKSTYGRIKLVEDGGHSGWDGGTFYTDLFWDDNDPILYAQVPEPGILVLTALGAVALVRRKRR